MQQVESASLKLCSTTFGERTNPALIILHGLFGSSTNWRSIIGKLKEELFIVAVDLRNHGQSPWHDSMTYGEMAIDVAALITDEKLENPAILGHSMGGKAAMTLAQKGLVPLGKLVIADIAPVPYQHSHEEFIQIMQAVDLDRTRSRSEADKQLAERISEPGIRQFLLQNLVRENRTYRWRINLEAIKNNLPSILGFDSQQPASNQTLFISGGSSPYIKPRMYPEMDRQFPHHIVETIDEAGHWIHAEKPEAFVDLIKQFLD